MSTPPLLLTMGEPAGIGPECALRAWANRDRLPVFFCHDDPAHLLQVSNRLGLAVPVQAIAVPEEARDVFQHALPVLPLPLGGDQRPGHPNPDNAQMVVDSIKNGVAFARAGTVGAIVTNPINKKALYETGFSHPGHTEFLAALDDGDPTPVMMLANDQLKAVPLTIHHAICDAVELLTEELIVTKARIVHMALKRDFGLAAPRLALSGLNPHAGEGGSMGQEEISVMQPAVDQLRSDGIDITDPLPADTLFHAEARAQYDVALCPTHDQALIPVKTLDFHGGVNVTLGLSYIRTSPDHGTAFDIAQTGGANPSSLIAAIKLAGTMAQARLKGKRSS